MFAPSEFAISPVNEAPVESWSQSTPHKTNPAFGGDFEDDDWNSMALGGANGNVGTSYSMNYPAGNHMFELGVVSTDGFGRRETRTLYVPHVNNLGELGLVVSGDAPVVVYKVDPGSAAARAGVDTGDELISIGGKMCARSRHQEVVDLFTSVITDALQSQSHSGAKTGSAAAAPQQKRWSADQGAMGFGGDFIGGQGNSNVPADVNDIGISLPGQAGGGFDDEAPQVDPYAPIREAAGRHQVEAARLMQEERFKEARVLLDRAIGLLQSIPQESESPQRPRRKTQRASGGHGFRPLQQGQPQKLALSQSLQAGPRKRRKPAAKKQVTIIHALTQLPEKVKGRECGFKPIKRYHVAQRRKTAQRTSTVTVTQSSPTRTPARQQAW